MDSNIWLEIVLAVALLGGIAAVFAERIYRKKGIGKRTIQLLSILMIVPLAGVLALREAVSGEAVATILGTVLGYVLADVGRDEAKPKT